MILPSAAGLKSLNDLERGWEETAATVLERSGAHLLLAHTWDFATLAVMPDYRGRATAGIVALALQQGVFTLGRLEGLTHCVAILDIVVLRQIQWQLKKPLIPFVGLEPRSYLGSPLSVPAWLDVARWQQRLLEHHPDLHDLVFEGAGLGAAVRLPSKLSALTRQLADPA
jgi:hypothetical protein